MKKKNDNKSMTPKVKSVVEAFTDENSYKTDPNGSWTGRPADVGEKPIQDADDL